jgi:iron complex transport system substrate-binding protein
LLPGVKEERLINFGAPTLREGLRRIVNRFEPSAFPRLRVNQGV